MTKSISDYYQTFFTIIAVSKDGIARTKDLQSYATNNEICEKRYVNDILKKMEELGIVKKTRVIGMRKLEGWTINEKQTNNEVWVTLEDKKGKIFLNKLTQKQLLKSIKEEITDYKKMIGNKKSELHDNEISFAFYHMQKITMMMSWIARLTIARNSGLLLDDVIKITLAKDNIALLEDFIRTMFINCQKHYPQERYDEFLTSMMIYFEQLDPFEGSKYSRQSLISSSTR